MKNRILPILYWFINIQNKKQFSISEAIGHAACVLAQDAGARAIVCCTRTGHTTRLVARYRPVVPIIGVSPGMETRSQNSAGVGRQAGSM